MPGARQAAHEVAEIGSVKPAGGNEQDRVTFPGDEALDPGLTDGDLASGWHRRPRFPGVPDQWAGRFWPAPGPGSLFGSGAFQRLGARDARLAR